MEKEYNFICDNEPSKHPFTSNESASPVNSEQDEKPKKEKKSHKDKTEPKESKGEIKLLPTERVTFTDAAVMEIINHYCHHESGVRNLRKAIDRVFRKIVTKLDANKVVPMSSEAEYQINTKNMERFLDVPPTDDNYFANINKQLPIGSSNGLAYVNDGYGTLMKIQFVKKYRMEEPENDKNKGGSFTTTGRLGEVFAESVEVVKIAVFNFLYN